MPPARLRLSGIHHGAVARSKVEELAGLAHKGLGHLDLPYDLGKAAISLVNILIFNGLKLLPALRGQRGEPHIYREEEGQQDSQWPVEPRGNG